LHDSRVQSLKAHVPLQAEPIEIVDSPSDFSHPWGILDYGRM